MFRINTLTLALAGMALSTQLFAAPAAYDASQSYSGGTQVSIDGKIYEAKWWVDVGKSPTAQYDNEWNSPWKLVSDVEPQPEPQPDPEPEPDPEPQPDPGPDVGPVGEICSDFNVYPDWTQGNHATGGDIMVSENVAYEANWWTSSKPGSDDSWSLHVNCDNTEPGTAARLSLPNPMDPVRLEVAGWPNHFVVMTPSTSDAPKVFTIDTIQSQDVTDSTKLTNAFISLINTANSAGHAKN